VVSLDETADDNCTPNFTCPVVEVKQDDAQDVKVEVADENNMGDRDSSTTAHEAGDLCVTQLKTVADTCTPDFATCPVVEVKQEDLQYVKVEVADVNVFKTT